VSFRPEAIIKDRPTRGRNTVAFKAKTVLRVRPLSCLPPTGTPRGEWQGSLVWLTELDCLGVAAAPGYGKPWIAFARQKFTRWIR
jgi:hypothetical protein